MPGSKRAAAQEQQPPPPPAQQQPQPPAYRLLAGDELGVLRVLEVPAGPKWPEACLTQKWGEANKDRGVVSLCCYAPSSSSGGGAAAQQQALVAVGRKGRAVELLDALNGTPVAQLKAASRPAPPGRRAADSSDVCVAAVAFAAPTADRPLQLVVGASDGIVSVCSCSSSSSGGCDAAVAAASWHVVHHFEVGSSLTCMALDSSGQHVLVGAEGSQPSIWAIASGSKLWQAKGGKPNRIGLVDKAFTTAVAFLPSSSSSSSSSGGSGAEAAAAQDGAGGLAVRFVAGSVRAKVLLYNTAAGRRPQTELAAGDTRITALAPTAAGGLHVWAADGTGRVQHADLGAKRLLEALKGAGGSVRCLAPHPGGEPLMASAGLDRFVRVHDTTSRAPRGRVYLKQQLAAVCWLPVPAAPASAAALEQAKAAGESAAAAATGAADEQQQPAKKRKKQGGSKQRSRGQAAA